ncbi:MAG: RagB/SusD family nutrient uptake outer membrane protein [Prolixibacteraceae bacterium]
MKLFKNTGWLVLIYLFTLPLGCSDDFLEQKNTSGISESTLFKSPADGVAIVTGIYNTFHNLDYMLKGIWFTANFLSQDFKNYGADSFFATYEIPTSFDPLNVFWSRNYAGIAKANAALVILEKMRADHVLTDEQANQLLGEVYFLRGLFYYYLAVDFGGVPLELEVVTDDGRHPRNTQDEVFTVVASDMQKASELLKWRSDLAASDLGRATKDAALAYLGDAQMWLKKYAEAVTTFDKLNDRCQLEENFINIHEISNKHGKESIFEVQFRAYGNMSWGAWNVNNHWIATFGMPEEISGFGYAYADRKLYDSFQEGDTRKLATVIGPGDEHPSPSIQISLYPKVIQNHTQNGVTINTLGTVENPWMGSDKGRSGYYGTKFWRNPELCGTKGLSYFLSPDNIMMMRYAQVLLSKAEAMHRSGNSQGALAIVQQIRDRGFGKLVNPAVTVPAPIETDVMKIILDEYRHELSGEISLWFVLRRSGEHLQYVKEKYGITIPSGKDLMPIPQIQIGVNQTLKQNPGY